MLVNISREELVIGIVSLVEEVLETKLIADLNADLTLFGLDSIKTIKLVVKIEEHYQIEFLDEELLIEYFSSVNKILELLSYK
ncbi:phosphopantetheine-binding protein [Paenibacillus pinihumi]|uniref:phosphopantetheine-binding protein n=1 Tax=Paenibacillus pinihumi TaxID=669462 RepID=UPI000564C148|nr:phosphopantetheine-binding protein [Paenibacillus pinihumi]